MDKTILLVDDDKLFRERLAKAFRRRDFTVFTAGGFEEGLWMILEQNPAMAVIDLKMSGKSGMELIAAAREANQKIQMVVLTGYGSIATATEAMRMGARDYLIKPADVDDILSAFAKIPNRAIKADQYNFPTLSLAQAEWEHINRVITGCSGNISLAAKQLDLHRRTLQRKLQKYLTLHPEA